MSIRRISILCLQETKWVGEKAKEVEPYGYKLWYTGKDKTKNGVGIIVAKDLRDDVVEVRRKGDRILLIKLVLGDDIFNVISVYTPQIGLDAVSKQQFWDDLDAFVRTVTNGEKLFIGGDLNGHVGEGNKGFERVHGSFGFGNKNEARDTILEFATAFDLIIANTFFQKRESHLITYRSGTNVSQIDFFLTRRGDRMRCKNSKVIPGESVTTQHRILVLDCRFSGRQRIVRQTIEPRIKW